MQCPRCHTENSLSARFCRECGAPLSIVPPPTQTAAAPPSRPITQTPVVEARAGAGPTSQPVQQAADAAAPSYPYSRVPGYSVLAATGQSKPARAAFWVGIGTLALTLLCCPVALGFAAVLSLGPRAQENDAFRVTVLAVSSVGFLLGLLCAGVLLFAGRPRRAGR